MNLLSDSDADKDNKYQYSLTMNYMYHMMKSLNFAVYSESNLSVKIPVKILYLQWKNLSEQNIVTRYWWVYEFVWTYCVTKLTQIAPFVNS